MLQNTEPMSVKQKKYENMKYLVKRKKETDNFLPESRIVFIIFFFLCQHLLKKHHRYFKFSINSKLILFFYTSLRVLLVCSMKKQCIA